MKDRAWNTTSIGSTQRGVTRLQQAMSTADDASASASPSVSPGVNTGLAVKAIHFIWLQGRAHMAEKEPVLDGYVKSWDEHFPTWTKVFWDEGAILALLGATFPESIPTYHLLPSFAAKSDLARYAILYAFGGMYVDTDMECLDNFECLLQRRGKEFYVTVNDRQMFMEATFGAKINNGWMYYSKI